MFKYNKFIIAAISIALSVITLTSCEKTLETEGISRITAYPVFEYQEIVSVPLGGTYSPDGTATEGGNPIEITVSGSVDVSNIGVYTITYLATNSDGFDGSAEQSVVVYNPNGAGTNVSGNIEDIGRPERKATITLVEGTPNIYYCTDMAFGGIFPLYFEMNGDIMNIIPQHFEFGVTQVNGSYDPVGKTFHIEIVDFGFTYDFQYQ